MTHTLHFYPALHRDESICIKHHDETTWVSVVSLGVHVAVYIGADELRRLIAEAQKALAEVEAQQEAV